MGVERTAKPDFDKFIVELGEPAEAKQMNLFVADDLLLNMYLWDYQGEVLISSREFKDRVHLTLQ
jgi:hypothetical protein